MVGKAAANIETAQELFPQDSATLSANAGGTPTGTVNFYLFATSDCSGDPVYSEEDVNLTNGTANTDNTSFSVDESHEPPDDALTPRETEVLGLLTTGQTNQQIAHTLTISKGTAKVHVERIIRKLGVSDRTQAAVRAIELGFTSLDTRQQPYP